MRQASTFRLTRLALGGLVWAIAAAGLAKHLLT
jgi:hypothetical protein